MMEEVGDLEIETVMDEAGNLEDLLEGGGAKDYIRRPALHGATDFISWTWEMINAGFDEVGWSPDGERIVVTNPERLASAVLPQYFRHAQYASWVRALNAYNFKKMRPGQWAHPMFRRGRPENLKHIARKQAGSRKAAAAAAAANRSTQLAVRMPSAGLTPVQQLQQEKAHLWLMEQRLMGLETEARGMRDADLEQKLRLVQTMQWMLVGMRHKRNGAGPRLHLNPEVLGSADGGHVPRITYKHEGSLTGGSSFTWGEAGDASSGRERSESKVDTGDMMTDASLHQGGASLDGVSLDGISLDAIMESAFEIGSPTISDASPKLASPRAGRDAGLPLILSPPQAHQGSRGFENVVEFYFNRLSIAADKSLSEGSGLNGSLTTAPSLQPGWQGQPATRQPLQEWYEDLQAAGKKSGMATARVESA